MPADFAGRLPQTLLCDEVRPNVGAITLNRPGVMNAYSDRMCEELKAAIAAFRDDDSLRALLITGAGERAFCTGGDLSGGGRDGRGRPPVAHRPWATGGRCARACRRWCWRCGGSTSHRWR